MRAYVPVSHQAATQLLATAELPGRLSAWVVDPAWRAGAPEVGEEEWEYEATGLAAAATPDGGVILALDADVGAVEDGATEVTGPIRLSQVAAVLTEDLQWYAVQELAGLLDGP